MLLVTLTSYAYIFSWNYWKTHKFFAPFFTQFFVYTIFYIIFCNPSKYHFWVKKLQNEPKSEKLRRSFIFGLQNGLKSDKQSIEIVFFGKKNYKTGRKASSNPSKIYFWVKKLQNGPKSDKQSVKKNFWVKKLQN